MLPLLLEDVSCKAGRPGPEEELVCDPEMELLVCGALCEGKCLLGGTTTPEVFFTTLDLGRETFFLSLFSRRTVLEIEIVIK